MAQDSNLTRLDPAPLRHDARSWRAIPAWQTAFNAAFLALFLLMAVSGLGQFMATRSPRSLAVLAVNLLFVVLFLARRPAREESPAPYAWALSMTAMMLPLLLRPTDVPGFTLSGMTLQILGLAGVAGGLLSLRRSFAVAPANRGVRAEGLYRIVRHPIYVSELTLILGVVLANPTVPNALIWLCECGLQLARARAEEQLLSSDPAYRAYRERVRYRLVPGLV